MRYADVVRIGRGNAFSLRRACASRAGRGEGVGLFGMLARREQAEEGGFGTPDSQRTGTTNFASGSSSCSS